MRAREGARRERGAIERTARDSIIRPLKALPDGVRAGTSPWERWVLERADFTAGDTVAHSERVRYGVASGSAGAAVHRMHRVHRTFSQSPVLRYFM